MFGVDFLFVCLLVFLIGPLFFCFGFQFPWYLFVCLDFCVYVSCLFYFCFYFLLFLRKRETEREHKVVWVGRNVLGGLGRGEKYD